MATLRSLSRTHGSQRGLGMIDIIETNSPLMRAMSAMNAWEEGGTTSQHRENIAASSIAGRAIGSSWTPSAMSPASEITTTLKIEGAGVTLDVTYIADAEINANGLQAWLDKQIKEEGIKFAKSAEIDLMLSTGASNKYVGMTSVLDGTNVFPLTSSDTRVINAASYDYAASQKSFGLNVDNTNYTANKELFLELMAYADSLVDEGNGKIMLLNAAMLYRMNAIAQQNRILGEDRTKFGQLVRTFNGIPMIPLTAGAILSTEDDDTATPLEVSTSIYLISPGEMRTSIVTNSGLEYWEDPKLQAGESGQDKWEIRAAWKIQDPNSIVRIRNIKL